MHLHVSIIKVIENEGIELKKSGKVYKGRCPFHEDKTPSFAVYEDTNRFMCFGCGERGDSIAFIMKLRNLTFKEARAYLGTGQIVKRYRKDNRQDRRRELIESFRRWCNEYYDQLSVLYRTYNFLIGTVSDMDEVESYDQLYHQLPVIEYHLDILLYGTEQDKFDLYKGVYDVI